MPIDATKIQIEPPKPARSPDVPVVVLSEIDELLGRPWGSWELHDAAPDHYAGRSYEVTNLTADQQDELWRLYEAQRWRVVRHGAYGTSMYSQDRRVFFRFVPPAATGGGG